MPNSIRSHELQSKQGVGAYAPEHSLGPTTPRRRKAPREAERARHKCQWHTPAACCVGCETQGRPGGTEQPIERQKRWGNRCRRSRRRGAATALEWRALRPAPKAVARSALPEARAEVSELVRTPMHGAVRGPVTGEARTGDAGAERDTASAARSASARTGRRMPGTVCGTSARPVSLEGKRSAQ